MISMSFWLLALLGGATAYRVVLLGDIHGDYDALIAVLRNNDVLDDNNQWLDATTKVLSVGDLIGRGHQDKQVLEFIKRMTEENPWFQNLGNHEIMQLRDDWRYAVDGEGIGFETLSARQAALARGSELGDWLRGLPAIRREADNLMIHASFYDPRNTDRTVAELNDELATFLATGQPRLVYDDMIWDRELVYDAYGDDVDKACSHLVQATRNFDVNRLFIGHTPVQSLERDQPRPMPPMNFCQSPAFNSTSQPLGALLWDIDVGISRWMHSNPVNVQLEINEAGQTVSIEIIVTDPVGLMQVDAPELEASLAKEETLHEFELNQ